MLAGMASKATIGRWATKNRSFVRPTAIGTIKNPLSYGESTKSRAFRLFVYTAANKRTRVLCFFRIRKFDV